MIRFRVDFTEVCSIGIGKIELLENIHETGSLRKGAKALRMSYRRGWLLLADLNHTFSEPIATARVGGHRGGGVELTEFGLEVVRCYRAAELEIESIARREFESIAAKVLASRPEGARAVRESVSETAVSGDSVQSDTPLQ
jgi:molybdate transport system regulatory protein